MRNSISVWAGGALLAVTMAVAVSSTVSADPRDFTLVNNTGTVISEVYVGPVDMTDWGDDVLGRDVLLPGEATEIAFTESASGTCLYDVKVVTDEGLLGELAQVDLCETRTVTFN